MIMSVGGSACASRRRGDAFVLSVGSRSEDDSSETGTGTGMVTENEIEFGTEIGTANAIGCVGLGFPIEVATASRIRGSSWRVGAADRGVMEHGAGLTA